MSVDGQFLEEGAYSCDSESLTISGLAGRAVVTTEVLIKPQDNTTMMGLYRSRTMYCTQCEAEGFRDITYYLDRPDVMSEFTTKVIADKAQYPVLLSNGNPIDRGRTERGRHFVTWHDPFKKPAYLFALVAGTLSVVKTALPLCLAARWRCRYLLKRKIWISAITPCSLSSIPCAGTKKPMAGNTIWISL